MVEFTYFLYPGPHGMAWSGGLVGLGATIRSRCTAAKADEIG